jgi:hypothetical protein
MKKNLKISSKSYETVFSFHINGEMGDLLVPTPPPPPVPFPPLTPPFPLDDPAHPGYPGYPGFPFELPPPIPPYHGSKGWRSLTYRYERDYAWNQWVHTLGWTYGEDAIQRFNDFKAAGGWGGTVGGERTSSAEGIPCSYGFSIPEDRIIEEFDLGMYPVDAPLPGSFGRSVYIAAFAHYYTCDEWTGLGETGLDFSTIDPTQSVGTFVMRNELFSIYLAGDTVTA